MPRNRLIFAILAFVLVASGCGGGDDGDTADVAEGSRPEAAASGAEPQQEAPPEPAMSEAEPHEDAPSGASPTSEAGSEEPSEQTTEAEPITEPQGGGFEWCSDVAAVWVAHETASVNLGRSEAEYEEALAAYESASDEVGKAEALETLDEAERSYNEFSDQHEQALAAAVHQMRRAQHASGGSGSPEESAYRRAWGEFFVAFPEVIMRARDVPNVPFGAPIITVAPSDLLDGNILAQVLRYRAVAEVQETRHKYIYLGPDVEERDRAAGQAAHAVYAQADIAQIAEALHAAATEAEQAAADVKVGPPERPLRVAYHVLLAAGSAVLVPYDADALAPYDAYEPDRDIIDDLQDFRFVEGYELIWPVITARAKAIEAALPAAIELAEGIDARLQAEAQAEAARQQEVEQPLLELLEELAQGSNAYDAFKRSLEESCQ